MDADSELKLYDHVEFLAAKTNPRPPQSPEFSKCKSSKKAKKRKPSQVCYSKLIACFFYLTQ